jgi:hypothetical protein
MRRSTWNPTRRNRNIGTAKAGRGLANQLVIPRPHRDPRAYWESLRDPVVVAANGYRIVVEPCLPRFVYAPTVDDVLRVLAMLPRRDTRHIELIIFRQPTRKQRTLSLVWDRLAYNAIVGPFSGPQ